VFARPGVFNVGGTGAESSWPWEERLRRHGFECGHFGEKFTIDGLLDDDPPELQRSPGLLRVWEGSSTGVRAV